MAWPSRTSKPLAEALALPAQERAEFTEALLESLDDEPIEAIETAWAGEVDRRLADARAGRSKSSAFDETLDRLSARLRARAITTPD